MLTLNQAIRYEGRLRPHRDGYGREEFAVVPLTLRRRGGLLADEMVGFLAQHGYHFEGENELLEAIATAHPPRSEAELEREAMQDEEARWAEVDAVIAALCAWLDGNEVPF